MIHVVQKPNNPKCKMPSTEWFCCYSPKLKKFLRKSCMLHSAPLPRHTELSVLYKQTAFAEIVNVGKTARVAYLKLLFRPFLMNVNGNPQNLCFCTICNNILSFFYKYWPEYGLLSPKLLANSTIIIIIIIIIIKQTCFFLQL